MSLIIKIMTSPWRQALLATLLGLAACKPQRPAADGGVPDAGPAGAARAEVLASGGACVLAAAKDFRAAAAALEEALKAAESPAAFTAARTAFHAAMDQWQISEVMQVGPAATSASLGGGDLRDQIYSWPLTSRCAIEETLVSKGYESGLGAQLINRRGLYALEYLLFYEGGMTACPATSPIVANGTWAALTEPERTSRRYAYAAKAAADVRSRADALVAAWDPAFLATLTSPGPSNAVFKTQASALNAMSDALFYVEHEVKDVKLARPVGLANCAAAPCLDQLESQFGGRSKANVKANLEGFRRIYQGCGAGHAGVAFDDLLRALGGDAVAGRMDSSLDQADAALAAIEEADLKEALQADPASVRALYDALKGATDELKTEVMSLLDLEIPMSLEGDND